MTWIGLTAAYALFVWWLSTGVIMYVDGLPRSSFRWSLLGASGLGLLAVVGLWASRGQADAGGAYQGFTSGLIIWGWLQATFYLGYITGPRRQVCAPGCGGWRHFLHGLETCLYHELAALALAALVLWISWGQPNAVGAWTYVLLWWMHTSAKLNVFLGVRNLNAEFLPDHLRYLEGFFRVRPMNLLFPVSVTASTLVTLLLAQAAIGAAPGSFESVGYTLLATLSALAVLEHWFLVLPFPAMAPFNWALRSRGGNEAVSLRSMAGRPSG